MEFKDFLQKDKIEKAISLNIANNKDLVECVFRRESEMFFKYFGYLRENAQDLNLSELDKELLETNVGEIGIYEGEEVPLDLPFMSLVESDKNPCWDGYVMVGTKMKDGKEVPNCVKESELTEAEKVELNKPKRGGKKKFYVYVKNDKGNVIKVSFGDPNMSVKFDDEAARKSFAARHNCDQKKDRTTPGYWSCNLPKYASTLGLSGGGNFYW